MQQFAGGIVMDYKKLGLGLGVFSVGLGLVEIAAPGRLARWLGVDGKSARTVIGLFGARELVAGGMLLRGPAVSTNAWNRVVGDAMDLGALGLAFTRSVRRAAVAGALGFVAGATIIDAIAGRGLAHQTGRTFPASEQLSSA
jgi:hypothetical protein